MKMIKKRNEFMKNWLLIKIAVGYRGDDYQASKAS